MPGVSKAELPLLVMRALDTATCTLGDTRAVSALIQGVQLGMASGEVSVSLVSPNMQVALFEQTVPMRAVRKQESLIS